MWRFITIMPHGCMVVGLLSYSGKCATRLNEIKSHQLLLVMKTAAFVYFYIDTNSSCVLRKKKQHKISTTINNNNNIQRNKKGNWSAEQIINIILKQWRCSGVQSIERYRETWKKPKTNRINGILYCSIM